MISKSLVVFSRYDFQLSKKTFFEGLKVVVKKIIHSLEIKVNIFLRFYCLVYIRKRNI